jgi:outer membrane protein assembly factor BamB
LNECIGDAKSYHAKLDNYPSPLHLFGTCLQRKGLHIMIKQTLFLTAAVLCPLGPAWAADWPQWRGPERTAISKETGLLQSWPPGGPKLLWTFRGAGIGFSCMSVVRDRLYSMGGKEGGKDSVYAIDLNTRKKLWSVEVGDHFVDSFGSGPRSTPTIDGNFLYAISGHGDLVCVETATGKKVWSQGLTRASLGGKKPAYGYSESPLVDGDQVVATPGGKEGTITAFDKKTGTVKWRSTTIPGVRDRGASAYASMIAVEVAGVRQYVQVTDSGGGVVGVRASDGKFLWKFLIPEGVNTPIHQDNYVYISWSNNYCSLVKLTADGGHFKAEEIYTNKEMNNFHGGVILLGEYLYGHSNRRGGGWICQNFKTGKTVWHKNPGLGMGSVTFADGNLYCYHYERGDVLLTVQRGFI